MSRIAFLASRVSQHVSLSLGRRIAAPASSCAHLPPSTIIPGTRCLSGSAMTAVEAGAGEAPQVAPESPSKAKGSRPPGSKRTMAMHVAYLGTDFSGLQATKDLPADRTVEGVLERAVYQAGLISEANYGDFRKTKWARSSRTDKGVHSLCTVIGVRLVVDDTRYESDPEGVGYARDINRHLPPSIRVLAVQRVTKKYNVRRWCLTRTYEYYLPAFLLGFTTPDGSSTEDAEKLRLFRAALQQYVGTRPFHNFAGVRSQYVKKDKGSRALIHKWEALKRMREAEREARGEDAGAAESAAEAAAEEARALESAMPLDGAAEGEGAGIGGDAGASEGSEDEAAEEEEVPGAGDEATLDGGSYEEAAVAGGGVEGVQWVQQLRWLDDPDPKDPVVSSHYRRVLSFTADDPRRLVEGGVPCLRLEVQGDSFMLNQIRNMVGAAVAVARGIVRPELLPVALSAPGRVTVPKAPPHTLLLSGNEFSPFAKAYGEDTPALARLTGPVLTLKEGGRAEQRAFREEVFDAAISRLLNHPDWERWDTVILPRYHYPPDRVAELIQSHKKWHAEIIEKRAAAAAAREAAEREGGGPAAAEAAAGTKGGLAEQQEQQQQ